MTSRSSMGPPVGSSPLCEVDSGIVRGSPLESFISVVSSTALEADEMTTFPRNIFLFELSMLGLAFISSWSFMSELSILTVPPLASGARVSLFSVPI